LVVCAPSDGEVIPTSKVNDETFSADLMGKGFAIIPSNKEFVAPISGEITLIADTGHAFSIKNKSGIEVLVHIGLETVQINANRKENEPLAVFKPLVTVGSKVCVGDPVMEVDIDEIKKRKYQLTTPVIALNESIPNKKIENIVTNGTVKKGDPIIIIK